MRIIWLSANKLGYELLKEAIQIKNVNIEGIITLGKDTTTVMYDGIEREKWYELITKETSFDLLRDSLDVVVLQDKILNPILGIISWKISYF